MPPKVKSASDAGNSKKRSQVGAAISGTKRVTRTKRSLRQAGAESDGDDELGADIKGDTDVPTEASPAEDPAMVQVDNQMMTEVNDNYKAAASNSGLIAETAKLPAVAESCEKSLKTDELADGRDNHLGHAAELVSVTHPGGNSEKLDSLSQNGQAESGSPQKSIVDIGDAHSEVNGRDINNDGHEAGTPSAKKAKISKPSTTPSTKKSRSKWDNADEMLTNPNAPLAKTNLRDLLCHPRAWEILSADDKKLVLAKFPDNQEISNAATPEAAPNVAALRSNDNFRHDIARYQENLREGKHDAEWIRQARIAHKRRGVGFYNEYLATRFEEDWGVAMNSHSPVEESQLTEETPPINNELPLGENKSVPDIPNASHDADTVATEEPALGSEINTQASEVNNMGGEAAPESTPNGASD